MTPIPKPPKREKNPKKRVRKQKRTSRAKLVRQADALWSALVKRKGVCEFSPVGLFPDAYPHECSGPLQAQHGIPRTHHATRWILLNGFAGCKGSHMYWTKRQAMWGSFLVSAWGQLVADGLWQMARRHEVPELENVIAELQAAGLRPVAEVHRPAGRPEVRH